MKIIKEISKAMAFVCFFAFLIFSCSAFRKVEDKSIEEKSMFCKIEDNFYWTIYYHKETRVMWVRNKKPLGSGDFTVLVDSNGKPTVWESERNE